MAATKKRKEGEKGEDEVMEDAARRERLFAFFKDESFQEVTFIVDNLIESVVTKEGYAIDFDGDSTKKWDGVCFTLTHTALKPYVKEEGLMHDRGLPLAWVIRNFGRGSTDTVPWVLSGVDASAIFKPPFPCFLGGGKNLPEGKGAKELWEAGHAPWEIVSAYLFQDQE
jgi:hypothetical protein